MKYLVQSRKDKTQWKICNRADEVALFILGRDISKYDIYTLTLQESLPAEYHKLTKELQQRTK